MKIKVSQIIVFRNAEKYLNAALNSILSQTYPKELIEIILVDGMSDDGSYELAMKRKAELVQENYKVKLLKNFKKTLASGWNIALKHSEGEVVCRIDCHGEMSPNYIKDGVKGLIQNKSENIAAIGGILENFGQGFWGQIFRDFYSSKFGVGNSPFRIKNQGTFYSDTVAMGVYWKYLFDEVGYFDENLPRNQDIALHQKFLQNGYKFLTDSSMQFKYNVRSDVRSFMAKAWWDGFWIVPSGGGRPRHFVPAIFVAYLFTLLAAKFLRTRTILQKILSIPLTLYWLLAIVFSFKDGRNWSRLFLPIAYFSYHLIYGCATILGLSAILVRKNYEV
jgi:glycosyltransferase involved in cell wall biosynthesis